MLRTTVLNRMHDMSVSVCCGGLRCLHFLVQEKIIDIDKCLSDVDVERVTIACFNENAEVCLNIAHIKNLEKPVFLGFVGL